ncbi:DUF1631 family protein [Pseudohalioglobus sediminis]|uniref:DUF1631 family protein n=1 Tax=Pseudohalioglobus sediminis TaxID=2606449 RepID=A0A5B0X3T6_9GAMM|nr:DUF1631 family protein [Pseudohalioglobus sediminis]KAA1193365.1 DUF1631 family protein [Pseudohalioglobus sediminis]
MSSPHPRDTQQPARLSLSGGALLLGDVICLPDGAIQLQQFKLKAGTARSGKVSLHKGMRAELSLPGKPWCGPIEVSISGVDKGALTLSPRHPDSPLTDRFLKTLSGESISAERAPSELTGANDDYTRLLRAFHDRAIDDLVARLPRAIESMQLDLLELSTRTRPDSKGRNRLYETAVTLRQRKDDIGFTLLDKVETYFEEMVPDSGDQSWQQGNENANHLGLVDLEEFEGDLALDRWASVAEDIHHVALEALLIRVATLLDADPLAVRLPVHVRQICTAFQQAMDVNGIAAELSNVVFEYFTEHLIRPLDSFYQSLNAELSEHGIRPELEELIQAKGTLLRKESQVHQPERSHSRQDETAAAQRTAAPNEPTDSPGEPPAADATASGLSAQDGEMLVEAAAALRQSGLTSQNVYQSVVDALNFRREAEGLADGEALAAGTPVSGTWEGATVATSDLDEEALADAHTIADALRGLQGDRNLQARLQEANSLRAYLAQHRDQLNQLRETSGLTADSLNQLDLVDNLFGTIRSQTDVTPELRPTLDNLQIPLARLALLDQRFFLDRDHVARAVVDQLAALATSANFPNPALEGRINKIVDEIVTEYEDDTAVFDRALTKIQKLSSQQERALSRNIERVVRIQEGQEKLQQARRAVADVINERVKPPAAPRVLLDLVESGWRDLLVLTHVKEGPDSATWADHIKTLDQLSQWLEDKRNGDLDEDMMMQRGLEAETLIDMVDQQLAAALPTNLSHQKVLDELRAILAGNKEVDSAEVPEQQDTGSAEKTRAKVEDLPRLRRWVRRVEQLEQGCWLTYRDKKGQKRRMQLAWVNSSKDRYIFVNERGQKIADLTAVQLARKLSTGVQPPAPADTLSVLDQSLYQTLEHVQKTLSFTRNHDSLTRLINRETLLDQMGRALRHAQVKSSQHAVLYLDIDQFNLVNDIYDEVTGDAVLQEFSNLLAQLHSKKSSSARIEGDQFAVLLIDRSLEQAEAVASKIREDIESGSMEIEGENVTFTVSIGVAPILEYSPSVDQVLESARSAMEHAKEQGRNRVQVYNEDQSLAASFRQEKNLTRESLEQALATDRFVLQAQPIVQVAIDSDQPVSRHYELLLALSNPDGTLSSPSDFISSAERYGFMNLVDRWVVREAFTWVSHLMDEEKEVPHLSINLSGNSITDDDFLEYLLEEISEFGVGTSRICFEITETGTISNLVKAADFVRAFRNIGCKFSIDDFGTGLASHNYLRELPVDYVKIDGTFVTGIHQNRSDYAMARSINDLAHFLGQETIAESVENEEIIQKLKEIGVDYLQGWGIARPKPLAEVTEDLSTIAK